MTREADIVSAPKSRLESPFLKKSLSFPIFYNNSFPYLYTIQKSVAQQIFDLSAPKTTLCQHLHQFFMFLDVHYFALLKSALPLKDLRFLLSIFNISHLNRANVSFAILPCFPQNTVLMRCSRLLSYIFHQRYNMNAYNVLYCSTTNLSFALRLKKAEVAKCPDVFVY